MKRTKLIFAAGLVATSMALLLWATLFSGTTAAEDPPTVPHYKCYNIVDPSPGISVELQTQFGLDRVQVGPATSLCLPALKNGEGSLREPHLKCYDIAGNAARPTVRLETQFGVESKVELGAATKLCIPAIKAIYPDPPAGELPKAPNYECYDIKRGGSDPVPTASVEDQFYPTPEPMPVGPAKSLCLPALKNGEGTLAVPHIECYQISKPLPNKLVNLLTQFGLEQEVQVLMPEQLCVPAIKQILGGVGGIQELPDTAESAPATAESSDGSSSLLYGAIAGGLAAAVVVITVGTWYTRRRWLR